MTHGNSLLGKFHLNEISPMPRDAFDIDVDAIGILNVSAQDEKGRLSQAKYECAKRTLSSWALSAGILVSLSEQQFADCDTTDVGCNEGLMDNTSMFAERNASISRYTGNKPTMRQVA